MNLTQKEWQQVLSVIQHLNDSLDDCLIRKQAGTALLDLLAADHFASYIWDDGEQTFKKPVFLNMAESNLALYENYYQFHDPITHQLQKYQRAVSVNEVMAQSELVNTEFFNDFLTLDGLYHGINIYVYDNGNKNIGDFRVWRTKGRANFEQRELDILDMIAPHFRNAMRNIFFAKHRSPSVDKETIIRTLANETELTKREIGVAIALLEGNSDKVISDDLNISMPTLRTHVQHIFSKLKVRSRAELCSKILFSQ